MTSLRDSQLNIEENLSIYLFFLSTYCPVAPTSEHKASVKRFVSLQFLNLHTVGRSPWKKDKPVARPLSTHRTTDKLP
jgi:hypothetical protein